MNKILYFYHVMQEADVTRPKRWRHMSAYENNELQCIGALSLGDDSFYRILISAVDLSYKGTLLWTSMDAWQYLRHRSPI